MNQATHNEIVSFIWGIADDVLRDLFKRGKYPDVILPMCVIRRMDAVLEPTKQAVLDTKKMLDDARITEQRAALAAAAGQAFYNSSRFTLRDLKSRGSQQQLLADFEDYLNGFSPNVQDILDNFKFRNQLSTLSKADALGTLINKFLDPEIDLSPSGIDNHVMGTIFEELVRKFNEENNEEAGEHWTPRDAVRLMANLVFLPIESELKSGSYLLYDCACGTGGMLTVAEETLSQIAAQRGLQINCHLHGQEINPETYAVCKADMLLKGEGESADHIVGGAEWSTLSHDAFPAQEFDFMLANLPRYFHHLYRTPQFAKEAERWSYGITSDMWSLRSEHYKMIYTPKPPPTEQAAIVRFLDWAHGRLERAIRAKRKVIALLTEQKQAIIHRAVTRGLDPSAPLKPSGIPWLGDIPQHWEVRPLRRCISIRSGDFADPLHLRTEPSESHCIPVVGGNGVMGFTDRANNRDRTIVIGRVGALCGNVHLIDGDAWVTDNALRITRISGFVAAYLAEQLRVMDLNRLANANAQPLVTGGTIKAQRVVKPPQDEQENIAHCLVGLTAPTDSTISRLEREIELLREYRTRLVADVVTGKLDVRAAAARLPREAGEVGLSDLSDKSDFSDLSDVSDGAGEPLSEDEP